MAYRNASYDARDRKKMVAFLGQVLDRYKVGEIPRDESVGTLAYVMTALATGNNSEVINWIDQWNRRIA